MLSFFCASRYSSFCHISLLYVGNTSGMTNGHTDSAHSLEKSSSIRTTPRGAALYFFICLNEMFLNGSCSQEQADIALWNIA